MPNPRASTQQKALRGTWRADRAPQPTAGEPLTEAPEPPPRLSEKAQGEWRILAPIVTQLGVLTAADMRAFQLLCECLGTAAEAEDMLREEGMTLPTVGGGTRAHPAIKAMEIARNQAARLMTEFGLTPKGRQAVDIAPAPRPSRLQEALGL
jgi:P27 family predicted phage terminase small subunit